MAGGPQRTVAVLAGGTTGERTVSLGTGRAVAEALAERGHRALPVELDVVHGRPVWSHDGHAGSPLALLEGPLAEVEAFFLALHGGDGEGGVIQGFLETLRLPHTGSGVAASALCLDKVSLLERMETADVRTARRLLLVAGSPDLEAELQRAATLPGAATGLVVKPRHGGSSVATVRLDAGPGLAADLRAAVAAIHGSPTEPDDALIEVRIPGVEASVGVLEDADGHPRALPVAEIRPEADRFFDYQQKYAEDGATELVPAESLPPDLVERLQHLSLEVHRRAGCSGYARVDFMCPEDGPGGGFGELCEAILEAGLRSRRACNGSSLGAE